MTRLWYAGNKAGKDWAERQEGRATGRLFSAEASHQISLMKWANDIKPAGAEASGIHAAAS